MTDPDKIAKAKQELLAKINDALDQAFGKSHGHLTITVKVRDFLPQHVEFGHTDQFKITVH